MTLQSDPERNERKFLHQFIDLNTSRKRVLEIGCGEGRLTWQYANETRSTVAIDLDRNALRIGSVDKPYTLEDKVHFACADSLYLPFAKEKFDIAILAWSL
jgi:Methylase involved in ubiquinone/menaquinone biosynthesis